MRSDKSVDLELISEYVRLNLIHYHDIANPGEGAIVLGRSQIISSGKKTMAGNWRALTYSWLAFTSWKHLGLKDRGAACYEMLPEVKKGVPIRMEQQ